MITVVVRLIATFLLENIHKTVVFSNTNMEEIFLTFLFKNIIGTFTPGMYYFVHLTMRSTKTSVNSKVVKESYVKTVFHIVSSLFFLRGLGQFKLSIIFFYYLDIIVPVQAFLVLAYCSILHPIGRDVLFVV